MLTPKRNRQVYGPWTPCADGDVECKDSLRELEPRERYAAVHQASTGQRQINLKPTNGLSFLAESCRIPELMNKCHGALAEAL